MLMATATTRPDPNLIYSVPIQTYFVDKDTGAPLSGGTVTFYKDTARTELKPIYQVNEDTPNNFSYTELDNPVTLTSVGTFASDDGDDINVFLYPYVGDPSDDVRKDVELYYVVVKNSNGVAQETRSAWPPVINGATSGGNTFATSANQITNEQFINVNGSGDVTYNVSGTNTVTEVAPGWFALTSGTGVITVSQQAIADTVDTKGTGAPYALEIRSTAPSALSLYQRLNSSPYLLAGGFVYGSVLVAALDGGSAQSITLSYKPSSGTEAIFNTFSTTDDEVFTQIAGTVATDKDNTQEAPEGYVDFLIALRPNITFQITSAQMMGVSNLADTVVFPQSSINQQTNKLYWNDKPQLEYKPIPSYLIGWDFPFNPAQFGVSGTVGAIGANKSKYIWDQTIAFQTVDNSIGFDRDGDTLALKIRPSADTSFALIQYLDATQARELLQQRMAARMQAHVSTGTLSGTLSLYWTDDATLPDLNSTDYKSLVSGITDGVPAVENGSWTKVPYLGNTNATFSLSTTSAEFSFSGFDDVSGDGKTTATFFAVVLAFDTFTATRDLFLDYCSLMGGDIATRPAPMTREQTIAQCQAFYEKSYDNLVSVGTASIGAGSLQKNQTIISNVGSSQTILYPSQFQFNYNSIKRTANPVVTLYSVSSSGTAGTVQANVYYNGSSVAVGDKTVTSFWIKTDLGQKGVNYILANANSLLTYGVASATTPASGFIQFQYSVDARLGLVV